MSLILTVDGDRCSGHARCYLAAAPDLLSQDEEGYVSVRGSSIPVPPDQEQAARAAVDSCPEHAISLSEGGASSVG